MTTTGSGAFLSFAAEEAKHIQLFRRFREEFDGGFGTACDMIGPPDAIGRKVLSYHPLAVSLLILHIEWMTQRHFLDSVQDDETLDPQFKSLLRHHWMEEVRHAKLDTLMARTRSPPSAAKRSARKRFNPISKSGLSSMAGWPNRPSWMPKASRRRPADL